MTKKEQELIAWAKTTLPRHEVEALEALAHKQSSYLNETTDLSDLEKEKVVLTMKFLRVIKPSTKVLEVIGDNLREFVALSAELDAMNGPAPTVAAPTTAQ